MNDLIDPKKLVPVPMVTLQGTQHETAELILRHMREGRETRVVLMEPFIEMGEYCESQLFTGTFRGTNTAAILAQLRGEYRKRGWTYAGKAYGKALRAARA